MTDSSTPQPIELLTAGYVAGNLTAPELEEFQQLLAQNSELAVEVNQLQETCDRVITGLHEVQPPPHLWNTIRTAAIASEQPIPVSRQRSLPWNAITGSLAAVLIVALGIDNYQLRQALKGTTQINALLQHSQTHLFALQPVSSRDKSSASSGSFVVNLEQQTGILTVQNLPAPPNGHSYRLWAMVDGDRLPCGQVNINAQGATSAQFSMPADLYDNGISGVFITAEPTQLSRYPKGSVVMQSSL